MTKLLPAPGRVDFGRRGLTSRTRYWQLRFDRRTAIVTTIIALATLGVFLCSLAFGDFEVAMDEVIRVLLGGGDPANRMVVLEWRLPRALLAIVLGAALALSGAVFQSLTRNPLGSPDIIGFSTGSYTGALIVILLVGGGYYQVALGSLLGGIATAGIVYVLAWRGGVQGFRLIIVGIGVSAMLAAVNTWLILRASLDDALIAAVWGAGSLNGLGLDKLWPVLILSAIIIPVVLAHGPTLRQMELGDDASAALGVSGNRSRLILVVLGVALTALVTAAAGPIGFVSLVAPQLARRLTRSAGVSLLPAAVMGAFLLALADFAAQRLFSPTVLPVGVLTVSIGGFYFLWLLVREGKKS
ncbi:FecCD family ABC transporter permease [Mycetocola spongiae]|uniref:FecCD family ABC transporter permease n=1 Tax=Mycetocola spongiae TaxID=2859226 RepID=UPI001CF0DE3D|nr:iron chelate uptake ABC transporter family permease subunit [Mycetocola spongiae]UCR88900.1 iron chelate uptake ABC transporter family permease subunit [Mycetocola spongiae]